MRKQFFTSTTTNYNYLPMNASETFPRAQLFQQQFQ